MIMPMIMPYTEKTKQKAKELCSSRSSTTSVRWKKFLWTQTARLYGVVYNGRMPLSSTLANSINHQLMGKTILKFWTRNFLISFLHVISTYQT